ncbi:hypothetical protein K402DRAFT_397985 [Aulographum hederae CBS 113979]|uniref:Uncharacterized protein n=1 Tax=Aulographum hederae CBS 113979 TaxID=1176131 RepID=A0A6G1GMC6_9PEZI|nr:hypothetical protein K402DRAFT_397985 [Aulographum hederae CBS 113979]
MVILVRAPSTCHVILLVLYNQHESKDIQRLHCPSSTAASFVSSDSRKGFPTAFLSDSPAWNSGSTGLVRWHLGSIGNGFVATSE